MIEIRDLKKQILLHGFSEEDYQKLAICMEYRHYQRGQLIFQEGDPSEGVYLIQSGRVEISKAVQEGRRRTLVVFRDGNFFGDISALEKRAHNATAKALSDVEIFLLKPEILEGGGTDDLPLSFRLLKRFALIASKNLRQMNLKYLRLEESF